MRKYLSCILVLLLLLSLVGCTPEAPAVSIPNEETSAVSEETSTPDEPEASEEAAESEKREEPESSQVEPETDPVDVPQETEKLGHIQLLKKQHHLHEWSDDTESWLVWSEHSTVSLTDEAAKEYPELAKVLEELAVMQSRTMEYEFDDLLYAAKEQVNLSGPENYNTKISKLETVVRRADSLVVSLLWDSYLDTGMIDGLKSLSAVNYDPMTGEKLAITQVIKSMEKLPDAVAKALNSRAWAGFQDYSSAVEGYFGRTAAEDISWTLDYSGVSLYFGDGDLEEPGNGCLVATINFAEHPELFEEKYMAVPEAYSLELALDSSYFTDLDGDGIADELNVTGFFSYSDMFFSKIGVYSQADGSYVYEDIVTEGIHPYYVKTAEGGHYIYLFCEQNDGPFPQMYLRIYDVSGGKANSICEKNMGPAYVPENTIHVPNDPEYLFLDDYDGALQDATPYAVGADGIPELIH